jgi:hypothetical protein
VRESSCPWWGLGQNRGTQRYRPRKVDGDRKLLGVTRKIVESVPRRGCKCTHGMCKIGCDNLSCFHLRELCACRAYFTELFRH